jgi:hypothetical protein
MGRPIKSVFFGNTNTGATRRSDNHIGGEGVASVAVSAAGSYTSALPTITFGAPEIPTGVRATGTVHGKALSAVVSAPGDGYNVGDTLLENIAAGNEGTYATWTVSGVTVTGITIQNGGTANDVGDEFTFSAPGFATPVRVRVTASNSGVATGVSIVNGGVWVTTKPANSTGMTRTQVAAGQDYNGTGLQVNFTAWGLATVSRATEGDYTAVTGGARATTTIPAGHTNNAATLTITYGIKSVVLTEPGSGYRSAPTVTTSTGAGAITASLTATQNNALDFQAYIRGGESALVGDIINQVTSTAYRVRTADGIGYAKLVASDELNEGEMTLIATDSSNNTYYVIRIQEHLVRVVQKDGEDFEFNSGSQVKWTFGDAVEGNSVRVANK